MNAELGLEIPRPNFNHVLFTPNVPQTGSSVRGGGQYHYTLEMWRQLLKSTNAARGYALQMPDASAAPARRGSPRVVNRD